MDHDDFEVFEDEIELEEAPVSDEAEPTSISSDGEIEKQFVEQPFRVVYQTNNFLLPQLSDLILDGDVVNIRPEYQRRLRWSNIQKSLLIESLLLNVPVPPVFFFENDLARYEVMDGQQRINAIKEFLNNEFSLRGLTVISSLNGRRYNKLPPRVKRSLDRASISAIVVLQESQGRLKRAGTERYYELRRFVFERLNTGGRKLNAQEIRNAIYGGSFNAMITDLARNDTFTRIWGIPAYKSADPSEYYEEASRQKNTMYRLMVDCQLVLRFFALREDEHIQGSMRSMLDKCMERNIKLTDAEIPSLKDQFISRLKLADELFDKNPFTLTHSGNKKSRPVAGVYDAVMVSIDHLWKHKDLMLSSKERIQKGYQELVKAEANTGSLTGSANTSKDIRSRIQLVENVFKLAMGIGK